MSNKETPEMIFNFSKLPQKTLRYLYDVLEEDWTTERGIFDKIKDEKAQKAIIDITTALELELERKEFNGNIPPEIMERIDNNYNFNIEKIRQKYK